MITILIYFLILLLIFGVVLYVIDLIPIPVNVRTIAKVIIGLILVLALLDLLLGTGGVLRAPLRLP